MLNVIEVFINIRLFRIRWEFGSYHKRNKKFGPKFGAPIVDDRMYVSKLTWSSRGLIQTTLEDLRPVYRLSYQNIDSSLIRLTRANDHSLNNRRELLLQYPRLVAGEVDPIKIPGPIHRAPRPSK
jgi:hypothetical protein